LRGLTTGNRSAAALFGAFVFVSGRLVAQPAAAISYSRSEGCPDEGEFRAELARHLRSEPGSARPIAVEAQQGEGQSIARVRFVEEDGYSAVRELAAPTCAEAVTAAALVVALAIDSRAQLREQPGPAPVAPAKPRTQAAPPAMEVKDTLPERTGERTGLVIELGGGVLAHAVAAPDPMFGALGFVGVGQRAMWDLRASFVYATSGTVARDVHAAEFELLGGRLDGCAFGFTKGERVSLDPCLAVEIGALRSAGVPSERSTSAQQTTLWMAAGPLLRGQAAFESLRLEAYAGPWFPVAGKHRFVFTSQEGERSFHEVPMVGLLAGVNLGVAFD
jgi:hypothetical protein